MAKTNRFNIKRITAFLLIFTFIFQSISLISAKNVFASGSFNRSSSPSGLFYPQLHTEIKFSFNFTIEHNAVDVFIKTSDGTIIKTLAQDQYYPGEYQNCTITWDGKDEGGNYVPDGNYKAYFQVKDEWSRFSYGIDFEVANTTEHLFAIKPNLTSDVFQLFGKNDGTVKDVMFTYSDDAEKNGDLKIGAGMWTQHITVTGGETEASYAEITAQRKIEDADGNEITEDLGTLKFYKHIVGPLESLTSIAGLYFKDEDIVTAVDFIRTTNGLDLSYKISEGHRLLIFDPTSNVEFINGGITENSPKFDIELLDKAGICDNIVASKDPVNLATGNFIYSNDDISTNGKYPVNFSRFYNSIGSVNGMTGMNWSTMSDTKVIMMENYDAAVIHWDGRWEVFKINANAQYDAPEGSYNTLVYNDDLTYTYTKPDGSYMEFDTSGSLTKSVDLFGNETKYTYGSLFIEKSRQNQAF